MTHDQHTVPIQQKMSKILCRIAVTFAMLLGFVNPSWATSSFSVSLPTLTYTGTVGGPNQVLGVTVTNTGTSTLTVTWFDSINWLVATSGDTVTMAPGGSATISHTASTAGLTAGTYSGTATISGGGTTKQVPITMTVTSGSATPAIGLNPTSLGFAGTVGGTNPSAQTIGISNVGGGTLTWTTGDNATWLTLSPLSGTNTGAVTASVNLAGLLSGSYTATVTVTATGATAKTVPVTLTVKASTSSGTIGFSPANLAFSGIVGGTNPAAQSFALTNTAGGTLSWTLTDNATWLQLNTASGTTTTETDTISASVTTSGLGAGTYNAIITVTASGSTNTPRQIPVSLTLSASTAGTATLTWNANTEADVAGYKVYRGTGSGTYGAPFSTLPKTTTSLTATGLQNGTTYFFVITVYDNAGNESTFSNEVSKSIF
jgi:fibronectin type III domain protein/BACON domain-containing protein